MTWDETLALLTPCLPPPAADALHAVEPGELREIRLRAGQTVQLCGRDTRCIAYTPAQQEIACICEALTGHSLYARSSETSLGYVTLRGGHRLGLCGNVHIRDGKPVLQHISSACLRIAAERPGCGVALLPCAADGLLLIGPPASGKTTLLRDLARQLSLSGAQTALIDERCELSACVDGSPQLDVGCSDVLSGLGKPEAVAWLVRSMAPQVIITDELAGEADAAVLTDANASGIRILASVHGRSLADALTRPFVRKLAQTRCIGAYAVLSALEPGRIVAQYDRNGTPLP